MVMSPVDILKPDYNRFPKFSQAKRLECVLKPGDALFMPAFWWHEVQSYPDHKEHRNLAVNYWYSKMCAKQRLVAIVVWPVHGTSVKAASSSSKSIIITWYTLGMDIANCHAWW